MNIKSPWIINIKHLSTLTRSLFIASILALTACGGGGGGSSSPPVSTTTTISGTAEAPGGVIAQFETSKPVVIATIDFFIPAAKAAITGLQPVSGATVELIRIDDDGNQVGTVLASTVTSITGNYSLALPTGVSLAGNLIVRISGTTASMSAMVVDQTVDINPVSQFVLDKFVDEPNLILADLPVNEVVALSGKVDEFDLTATADLSSMLQQLETEVGQFVNNEVAVIASTPDDGTAAAGVAGNWNIVEFDLGMHDSDPDNTGVQFGTFEMDVFAEAISFTDAGNGNLTLTDGTLLIDAFSNYSVDDQGNPSLFHETSISNEDESFTAMIDAEGNISISTPFEEELETVDIIGGINDPENDGPNFGWRFPPSTLFLHPVANNNTYVLNNIDAGVRYQMTDTNSDGINDAIDPNARSGDEVSMLLLLALKQGSGMTTSSIDGDFGWVAVNVNLDTSPPVGVVDSTVGVMNFSSGTATSQANSQDVQEIIRSSQTFTSVTLTDNQFTEPDAIRTFPYTVSSSGQVTLDVAGDLSDVLEGFSNNDGSVMAFVDSEATGTPVRTSVNNELLIAVKLGSAVASSLDGATYDLYPMTFGMETDGSTRVSTLSNGTVVFNADASSATVNGTDRGFERQTDVAEVESLAPENLPADAFTVDSVAANGAFTLTRTLTEGEVSFSTSIKGFVSADGNLLITRVFTSGTTGEKDIGLAIGIKQ